MLTPVPVKNDPFAEFFGNQPIWLPYDANDPFNGAKWFADIELAFPASAERRRSLPLFPADGASSPLTHGMADAIFRVFATTGLDDERAAQLSLYTSASSPPLNSSLVGTHGRLSSRCVVGKMSASWTSMRA